jgi:hypothetical protein
MSPIPSTVKNIKDSIFSGLKNVTNWINKFSNQSSEEITYNIKLLEQSQFNFTSEKAYTWQGKNEDSWSKYCTSALLYILGAI